MDKEKNDPFNSLPDLPRPDQAFKRAVLARTEEVVRKRRVYRRLLGAAALFLAYLVGVFSSSLYETQDITQEIQRPNPRELVKMSQTGTPREKVELLKQAGDLYLNTQYDVENALACYSSALDMMEPSEKARVSPTDSWLLAALKGDRR